MKKIGLTGIIGSGKTTAALYFKGLGVPVFIADDCAKELMENDDNLKNQIINLLGDSAYLNGKLNKEFISEKIFNDTTLLSHINNIVHPKVHENFNNWISKQNSKYIIYEAALIFENNSQHIFDKIICIKTPLNLIFERINKRENYSEEKVRRILNNQIPQDLKCSKSDFCIENISKNKLYNKLLNIHNSLI
jgi:dephospho-CoA kinase